MMKRLRGRGRAVCAVRAEKGRPGRERRERQEKQAGTRRHNQRGASRSGAIERDKTFFYIGSVLFSKQRPALFFAPSSLPFFYFIC